jgi:methylated-DNA-[protein]-cysteine S-methyltransferase
MGTLYCHVMDSPLGPLRLTHDRQGLTGISFQGEASVQGRVQRAPERSEWLSDPGLFAEVLCQLRQYFDGERCSFDVPLAAQGTAFQHSVWRELQCIPYGQTISYGELARRIGKPRACRAVGLANGANPLPIIVPCHRVIGADGSLTGFGGGLPIKRQLLALEQSVMMRQGSHTGSATQLSLEYLS